MKHLLLLSLFLLLSCKTERLTPVIEPPPCIPTAEICDGLDNDCDGLIDEYVVKQCSTACGQGSSSCKIGVWSECNAPKPKEEVCDGKDNDCDGIVDNDIEIKPCYPRDQKELMYGECRFGVTRCRLGSMVCSNWVGPTAEVCDGKDNNCNGTVDEGNSVALDVVIAMDYSASMMSTIDELRMTTATWANKYVGRADLRFALVGIPSDDYHWDATVKVMANLGDAAAFVQSLNMHMHAAGGGQEPTIDAVYEVSDTSNPLSLDWHSGARRAMVMFTDEDPQSYLYPQVTSKEARDLAISNAVRVFIFTSAPGWIMNGWSPQGLYKGQQLEDALDSVIAQGSCQ